MGCGDGAVGCSDRVLLGWNEDGADEGAEMGERIGEEVG